MTLYDFHGIIFTMKRLRIKGEASTVAGAPTKLTADLIDHFTDLIIRGLPIDGVCDYLSINPTTFWMWVHRGERRLGGETGVKSIYGEFLVSIRQAGAEYRLMLVDRMHTTHSNLWTRDMAILERRDRKNFARIGPVGGEESEYDPDEKFL